MARNRERAGGKSGRKRKNTPPRSIKSCKLLGVHINEHLKWDDHIKHTVSGCYATLSILRKLKYLAKYELRKQLAETLILSKLDYADLVFYPLPQFLLRRLQRVQFAAASFALGHYVGMNLKSDGF